jgi:hypothetical protein
MWVCVRVRVGVRVCADINLPTAPDLEPWARWGPTSMGILSLNPPEAKASRLGLVGGTYPGVHPAFVEMYGKLPKG